MISTGEALVLSCLVTPTPHGIASRILAKTPGGSVTLFAFDTSETLTEHTSPFEALAFVLNGACRFTVGGTDIRASSGTVLRLPADVRHDVEATGPTHLNVLCRYRIQPLVTERWNQMTPDDRLFAGDTAWLVPIRADVTVDEPRRELL